MAAVAACHLAKNQSRHQPVAWTFYAIALKELHTALPDPIIARLDSTLGACLMLCVFEISLPEHSRWSKHLRGARDLILLRGRPKTPHYLTRIFSRLDVSAALTAGRGPLIQGEYWLEEDVFDEDGNKRNAILDWPAYDLNGVMINHFHYLMTFMAQLSRLSSESMATAKSQGARIDSKLAEWWQSRPPVLRDQENNWRCQLRSQKLTLLQTLEKEAFSSIKSCMYGCVIYLNHLLNPLGCQPESPEVTKAIKEILENAQEVPEGYGLEMGHYWGLFMVGISVFNDKDKEALLRRKLSLNPRTSIYALKYSFLYSVRGSDDEAMLVP
ncbi:uncharacterized protein RAG0_17109 [Rhynchosporium agropyri]|uniref:C6 finger domain protein n=1 Tax=Rhynchosporium agropyri TaxID=914238 RepID=A0A1E1LUL7_9HELO|nr:uncharacterized protein RAG0_17109 [Rhynchosporium agropyri]